MLEAGFGRGDFGGERAITANGPCGFAFVEKLKGAQGTGWLRGTGWFVAMIRERSSMAAVAVGAAAVPKGE